MARSQLPIPKIINGVVGTTTQVTKCSFEVLDNKCLCGVFVTVTIAALATGAASKTIPTLAQGLGNTKFMIGSTAQRESQAAWLFGAQGLNALDDAKYGGYVQYLQAGVPVTSTVNGVACGALPVLIGSAQDLAIQAALGNNTATTAVFRVFFPFAEDFRKDVTNVEAMKLPIAYGTLNKDGSQNVQSVIKSVFFALDIPIVPNTAGLASTVTITASEEFDETLLTPGSGAPNLMKQKYYQDSYQAGGQIELADQFTNTDSIQAVSFLTTTDPIVSFVVKQGERIIRDSTFEENVVALAKAGLNINAIPRNRLDIVFDANDDPSGALPIRPNAKLSIKCVFANSTANAGAGDLVKQVTILPVFYGPVE